MTKYFKLVFILNNVFFHLISGEICDEAAQMKMTTEFRDCATKLSDEFEDTKNTFNGEYYVQEAACILLNKTVKHCGKSWRKCHSEEEVQHLEDMYLESLLSQYKDIQLDHCQVVMDYMQSGRRNKIIHHEEKCDEEHTLKIQNNFQSCSQTSSTEAYQKILDVENKEIVKKILCDALNTITNVCRADLATCFSDEDIEIMNESNLKQMKTFLVRIARGKVDENALEFCDTRTIKHITDEKHSTTTEETKTTETHSRIIHPDINTSINEEETVIEKENDKRVPTGPIDANKNPEKIIENNEKQKKAKDMMHAKTTVNPPKAAYKTNSESSAIQFSVCKTILLCIVLYFLK